METYFRMRQVILEEVEFNEDSEMEGPKEDSKMGHSNPDNAMEEQNPDGFVDNGDMASDDNIDDSRETERDEQLQTKDLPGGNEDIESRGEKSGCLFLLPRPGNGQGKPFRSTPNAIRRTLKDQII